MPLSVAVRAWALAVLAASALPASAAPGDLIPTEGLRRNRPRLLLRPADTPLAVSLPQLKALPRDNDFQQLLRQLQGLNPPKAAALALAHHLSGRPEDADRALAVMKAWQLPDKKGLDDPFTVYFTLLDFALAYDWLHGYPGFDAAAKAALRQKLLPLAESGFRLGEDHVFHNYVWMFNGGAMLWALATAGEDPASDRLLARLRDRFNGQLFRAMEYLDGDNGDAAGYWWRYCQNAAVLVLLAAQSAFETDLAGAIRKQHGDWLGRQLDDLAASLLPDLRFMPWGDIVAGANGGATHEMAGRIDALAWALRSPVGATLSRWLAGRRGLQRYYGDSAIFHVLYARHLAAEPAPLSLAVQAGGKQGGHVILRSDGGDGATVVGFRCTDYYGQHHHLDQGSFVVFRNGLLALDAGTYRHVNGPQMETSAHSTLLFGGEGQRRQNFQNASTLEAFTSRLPKGLETGDMPFFKHAGDWSAAAGQFAQAYAPETVRSCARQLLFVRPGIVAVVDQVEAPEGKALPEVRWLLQVPGRPEIEGRSATAASTKSWLRCRALLPGAPPKVEESLPTPAGPNNDNGVPPVITTSRVAYAYEGKPRLVLVHLLEVGDGKPAAIPPAPPVEVDAQSVRLTLDGKAFVFSARPPFEVAPRKP